MKITIEPEKCIGAGHCVRVASKTFAQRDDDGVVILLEENPPAERQKDAVSAARLCPARAIKIETE